MKHVIYKGPGGRRIVGKLDGLDRDYDFTRGRPLEATDADAKALIEGPHRREFAEASDDEVKAEKARVDAELARARAEREAAEQAAPDDYTAEDTAGKEA